MDLWGVNITAIELVFLTVAVGMCLAFEMVNGFHDTANAVATVIYTNTLKPTYAVIWSGIWNLIGAIISTGTVAYTIIALLPADLVLNSGSGAGFAMIFSILISAIVWNLGTWYLGLPASSSHTLIGAIMGVGIGYALWNGHPWTAGLNFDKVWEVVLALLISPLVGFVGSALLFWIVKTFIPNKQLFESPQGENPPPAWIRAILICTCTGVSYSHGSNDAQKGMGLMMLILVGIVPGAFALDMTLSKEKINALSDQAQVEFAYFQKNAGSVTMNLTDAQNLLKGFNKKTVLDTKAYAALAAECQAVHNQVANLSSLQQLNPQQRYGLRTDTYLLQNALRNAISQKSFPDGTDKEDAKKFATSMRLTSEYIPAWVKLIVAVALGIGTMVGWKRIVVTVGEKIGKAHLTYAQGASAEFVAMCTVIAADNYNAPVSTTHVLSSGIAGTMAASGTGVQMQTLINIILAWVLTLPVCIFLGATLFSTGLYILFHL